MEILKYEYWPVAVKIATAFSHRKFLMTNHKATLFLGYLLIGLGVIDLLYQVFFVEEKLSLSGDVIDSFAYLLIGSVNIWSGYAIKWVNEKSTWDERFESKSSVIHKMIYFIVTLVLLASLYFMFTSS